MHTILRAQALAALLSLALWGDNLIHPTTPVLDRPTLITIGIQLPVTGDDNYNAAVSVRYRKTGDATWKQGQPLYRVHPDSTLPYVIAPQFAGSIFDLRPATSYEIQLHLTDPDGPVDQTYSLTATTRGIPADPPALRQVSVSDANSLNAALSGARPGDIITLANGTYSGQFAISSSGTATNPIVIRGASRDGVILDGADCYGCNVLELYGSYFHVERLTVQNAERGIRFQTVGAVGNVVRGTRIRNVLSGIGAKASQFDSYIADNIVEGRIPWPAIYTDDDGHLDVQDGILVEGSGHVIAHNTISGFGDAMKVAQDGARSNDFYGNDILWTYDNGVELDTSEGNVRLMRNRFTNTYNPISAQPIYGGPAYIFRNVAMNTVVEELKLHSVANPTREPNGVFIYHNTFVSAYGALILETPTAVHHFALENNLFIGPPKPVDDRPVDFYAFIDDGLFDYNGYWPDGIYSYNYRTGRVDIRGFAALQQSGAGLEPHGLLVNPQTLASGIVGPQDYSAFFAPQDFTLSAQSVALDRGVVLANINDGYAGSAPDLGAMETGCPQPVYGPRPAGVDETNETFGCGGTNSTAPTPPTVDSASPSSGAGTGQTFAFKYSSGSGFTSLNTVAARINSNASDTNGCSISYNRAGNLLSLVSDAGTVTAGSGTAPGTAVTLQNSQCSLDVGRSPATGSGNTLTLTVAVAFKPAFAGAKSIAGSATDNAGLSSGWQTLGTFTATAPVIGPPTVDSISPASGSGAAQRFTLQYTSGGGYGNLSIVYALINSTLAANGACFAYYQPASGLLTLVTDGGGGQALKPGLAGTLENGQCSIDMANSSASGAGNTLTLALAITFNAGFGGPQQVFGFASDSKGAGSGWQTLGNWNATVPVNISPTSDSVTPNAGTASVQTFTFKYSSANGYAYLSSAWARFNSSATNSGACIVYYVRDGNTLNLANDSGDAVAGSATLGSAVTLQNGQCSVDVTKASVNGSGNTLALTVEIAFKPSFGGANSIYATAFDSRQLNSGWRTLGSWTLPPSVNSTIDSFAPKAGAGLNQKFTLQVSSPAGYRNLNVVQVVVGHTLTGTGTCYAYYDATANVIGLIGDAGNEIAGAPAAPGSSGKLENSQCSIDLSQSAVAGSGNSLTLALQIGFKPSFSGSQNIYAIAIDKVGWNSRWRSVGTWTVQ